MLQQSYQAIKCAVTNIKIAGSKLKNIKLTRFVLHYSDVIMGTVASQITSLMIVYSIVYSDADQRKHQSTASPAFLWEIHRGPLNSPDKWPVTRKMFPFGDVIMEKQLPELPVSPYHLSILCQTEWQQNRKKSMIVSYRCFMMNTTLTKPIL